MATPTVSFVVPCYRLAHLLGDCIDSILSQTYSDFEVLVMDDASPDNTGAVAAAFTDNRIRYIRNHGNLGHLANYNKGVKLTRGRYVWLISADDRLRRTYILERYIEFMERHPNVGFVCCPGVSLEDGVETNIVDSGYFGLRDKVFSGRKFIEASLRIGHGLLAPSVMVRKECYEKCSMFPLDMPHQGDWYLWFRWALDYDVGYMCEPMVNYRLHDLNIMKGLIRRAPATVFKDELEVLWRTKRHCEHKHLRNLARKCEDVLTARYARAAASRIYTDVFSHIQMTVHECQDALRRAARDDSEYQRLRAKFCTYMANQHWRHGEFECARQGYALALHDNWRMPLAWLKITLLAAGLGRMGLFFKNVAQRRTWNAV